MNRRELLKTMAGTVAAIGACGVARQAANPKRYGPITVQRHMALSRQGIHLHVFHQGKDITRDCRFADDTGEGIAEVLLRDANGYVFRSSDGSVSAILNGITIQEGDPL